MAAFGKSRSYPETEHDLQNNWYLLLNNFKI